MCRMAMWRNGKRRKEEGNKYDGNDSKIKEIEVRSGRRRERPG